MTVKQIGARQRVVTARRVTRGALLLAAVACVLPGRGPDWLACLVPSLSSFNALLALLTGAGIFLWPATLGITIACALRPRLFCRWICPTGTCQEAVAWRRRRQPWMARIPKVGLALLLLGVGGALAGAPLFGWLDPMSIFSAVGGLARRNLELRDWLAAAGLPLLLLLALAAPGLWCARFCPFGALQDLLYLPRRLRAERMSETKGTETHADSTRPEPAAALIGRRLFLSIGAGAGLAPLTSDKAPGALIRPPMVDHAHFTRLCTRCGTCVRNCPSRIIKFGRGGGGAGWLAALAPEIDYSGGYCPPACTICGEVCPSGAIPLFNTGNKHQSPMGRAVMRYPECYLTHKRECAACVGACQYGALSLQWDAARRNSRVVVDAGRCTGCGCCEYVCPATPLAIKVVGVNATAS